MQREIRFRGYCSETEGFVYGDLIQAVEEGYTYILEDNADFDEPLEVDPSTVGQFTGFRAVDGTPIYEGDFVTSRAFGERYDVHGVVTFSKGGWFVAGDNAHELYEATRITINKEVEEKL